MTITLSNTQKQAFRFFGSDYDMLFADGAVRSGKTYSLTHAFLLWTLNFDGGYDFGLAGRTIGTPKSRNTVYSTDSGAAKRIIFNFK